MAMCRWLRLKRNLKMTDSSTWLLILLKMKKENG